MPKAEPLTAAAMNVPQVTPQAATVARGAVATDKVKKDTEIIPLQVRLPREQVRAIKRAAVDRDQTISEFVLECFHAYMNTQ